VFLEVITGPMFSCKSEELLRRIRRAAYADKKILVVRPGIDKRATRNIFNMIKEDKKLSRYLNLNMVAADSFDDLLGARIDEVELLAIDEAQFIGKWLVNALVGLLNDAKRDLEIIVVGLDMDAWRNPFGIMPELMARANSVLKLTATCIECKGKNGPAIFTQKKSTGSGQQVEVGDKKLYEARCRICHTIPE
jgi:thymidine kinase